jgi:hypothetical protein
VRGEGCEGLGGVRGEGVRGEGWEGLGVWGVWEVCCHTL